MPPKLDPNSPANQALHAQFTKLGLSPATATELVRQPKQGAAVKALIEAYQLDKETLDEKTASALVKLAVGGGKLGEAEKGFAVQKVIKGDVTSNDQVTGELRASSRLSRLNSGKIAHCTAAIKYLEPNPAGTPINEAEFDKTCGVGTLRPLLFCIAPAHTQESTSPLQISPRSSDPTSRPSLPLLTAGQTLGPSSGASRAVPLT